MFIHRLTPEMFIFVVGGVFSQTKVQANLNRSTNTAYSGSNSSINHQTSSGIISGSELAKKDLGAKKLTLEVLKHIADNYGKVVRVVDPFILLGHDALRNEDEILYRRFHSVYCLDDVWAISLDSNFIREQVENPNLERYFQS